MSRYRYAVVALLLSMTAGAQEAPDVDPADILLMWEPPTQFVDGNPMFMCNDPAIPQADLDSGNCLDAYTIFWGRTSRVYSGQMAITDESQTMQLILGLEEGDWYFSMTALDRQGDESAYSNEVRKTVILQGPAGAGIINMVFCSSETERAVCRSQ